MRIAKSEQETICRIDSQDRIWHIYSAQPEVIRKLMKSYTPKKVTKGDAKDGLPAEAWFEVPLRTITFRTPAKARAPMSDEERARRSERMKKRKEDNTTNDSIN
jgi:hypothetical protein